jgi:tetratricopeptide (TPR) repeat protein
VFAGLLIALPIAARSQTTPRVGSPKRTPLASVTRPVCSSEPSPRTNPGGASKQQARAAAARAEQAAILGDTATTLASLRDARRLDPTDADVAYRLARLYETGGARDSAVAEFCRFLALAPSATDAADARGRVAVLAKPTLDPAIETANARFKAGLRAWDAGRMAEADSMFSRALETQPSWADDVYDRALARLGESEPDLAASDFELYLRLNAAASDRDSVVARIALLRRPRFSAVQAFSYGVIIPGAGQFYTHRPVRGTAVIFLSGAAFGSAFIPKQSSVVAQQTGTDPFGNPYTYSVTKRSTDYPYLAPGIAIGGAIALLGAFEAASYARTANDPGRRVSIVVEPSRGLLGLRVGF